MDNWKHRSDLMKCKTCMWFVPKVSGGINAEKVGNTEVPTYKLGRCRRHCPAMGGFPIVFVADWCGDHRLDENRI